ncbi:MAG: NAD-dependent succinate-semialdehyde dehydrogenase [Hyphomicrobium sp.]|uniref:NAD-dependent succinate-semialdehyde dehydrogenase n=1 Tax=Hyphomicrobium sp. TaxID=82 RepID=UPI003D13E7A0
MYDGLGLYIDGKWRPSNSGRTFKILNPANEEVLGELPVADEKDLDEALAAAQKGLALWRKTTSWERSKVLRKVADLLRERADSIARTLTLESGKPLPEARLEVGAAADQFDWFADEARRIYGQTIESRIPNVRNFLRYEPVGVVAAFTAWNFPVVLVARKIAPALAAGCSIIVKPAVVNAVVGDPPFISSYLLASPITRKVTLTGSIPVGKQLLKLAADTVKRASMELGGHAPFIVFEDADLAHAAELGVKTKFRNNGQVCVSPTRFFVHESKLDDFTERFIAGVKKIKIGNGLEEGVDVGPLINKKRLDWINDLVADSRKSGATIATGGQQPTGFNRGYFYEPTVITGLKDTDKIMTTEPFGPVALITSFKEFDEVIARANQLPFGLASYLFTRSLKTANEAYEQIETGIVGVNHCAIATAELPFGGMKESGMGREGGSLGIKDFLEPKYATMLLN